MKTTLLLFLLSISLIASQAQNKQDVADIPKYMVDAKTFSMIESKKAFYVVGGNKYGIMTKRIAFLKKENAQEFAKINGGEVVDYDGYVESLKKSQ